MRKEEEAHASQAAAKQISTDAAVVGVSSKLEGFLSLNETQRRTQEVFAPPRRCFHFTPHWFWQGLS